MVVGIEILIIEVLAYIYSKDILCPENTYTHKNRRKIEK